MKCSWFSIWLFISRIFSLVFYDFFPFFPLRWSMLCIAIFLWTVFFPVVWVSLNSDRFFFFRWRMCVYLRIFCVHAANAKRRVNMLPREFERTGEKNKPHTTSKQNLSHAKTFHNSMCNETPRELVHCFRLIFNARACILITPQD